MSRPTASDGVRHYLSFLLLGATGSKLQKLQLLPLSFALLSIRSTQRLRAGFLHLPFDELSVSQPLRLNRFARFPGSTSSTFSNASCSQLSLDYLTQDHSNHHRQTVMSPRRSSRSKTSQPMSATQHPVSSSSSSSMSSSRADRRSHSENKLPSPRSSVAPGSPTLVDREVSTKPHTRRTRSNQEIPKVEADEDNINEDGGDEEDEEEVTRCVCGQQEYPGMPAAAAKNTGEQGSPTTLQEDTGGLFIQCDNCKVWQHGGCVGIMDEATTPDEYFCEQCRTDLHRVTSTAAG